MDTDTRQQPAAHPTADGDQLTLKWAPEPIRDRNGEPIKFSQEEIEKMGLNQ